jgi:hypothetical protein
VEGEGGRGKGEGGKGKGRRLVEGEGGKGKGKREDTESTRKDVPVKSLVEGERQKTGQ